MSRLREESNTFEPIEDQARIFSKKKTKMNQECFRFSIDFTEGIRKVENRLKVRAFRSDEFE